MTTIQQLTIDDVGTFKKTILDVFAAGQVVELDLSELATIDLAGLQFLVALVKETKNSDKKIVMSGTLTAEFRKVLDTSGISSGNVETAEVLTTVLASL